jgi:hypothetical protein
MAVVEEGSLYGKDTSEITGGSLNLNAFNQTTNNVQSSSENLRESFEKKNPWSVAGVVVSGIFEVGKSMINMILTPFTLIGSILTNVLHIPAIVINVVLGLLILSLIFGLWSLLKVGN